MQQRWRTAPGSARNHDSYCKFAFVIDACQLTQACSTAWPFSQPTAAQRDCWPYIFTVEGVKNAELGTPMLWGNFLMYTASQCMHGMSLLSHAPHSHPSELEVGNARGRLRHQSCLARGETAQALLRQPGAFYSFTQKRPRGLLQGRCLAGSPQRPGGPPPQAVLPVVLPALVQTQG